MKKVLSLIGFVVLIFFSCNSKNEPIDDLKDLSLELQENSNNYTEKDWEEAKQEYENIDNQLKQYNYTDEELKEIGKLKSKCSTYFMKSYIKSIRKDIHNFSKEIEGAAEGVREVINGENNDNDK
jgi:peptidoglycan hydrolase CwlO-like protein